MGKSGTDLFVKITPTLVVRSSPESELFIYLFYIYPCKRKGREKGECRFHVPGLVWSGRQRQLQEKLRRAGEKRDAIAGKVTDWVIRKRYLNEHGPTEVHGK